jgi:hypothetical protein
MNLVSVVCRPAGHTINNVGKNLTRAMLKEVKNEKE